MLASPVVVGAGPTDFVNVDDKDSSGFA